MESNKDNLEEPENAPSIYVSHHKRSKFKKTMNSFNSAMKSVRNNATSIFSLQKFTTNFSPNDSDIYANVSLQRRFTNKKDSQLTASPAKKMDSDNTIKTETRRTKVSLFEKFLRIFKSKSRKSPVEDQASFMISERTTNVDNPTPSHWPNINSLTVLETPKPKLGAINVQASITKKKSRKIYFKAKGFGKNEYYIKSSKIGHGTYATVYKGWSRIIDRDVALKEIKTENDEGAPCTAIREISLLRNLNHSNIVLLHDVVYTNTTFMMVFEFLVCDLKQYMEHCYQRLINLYNTRLFLFQIIRGLKYCHSKRILHRDLKPQNLLLSAIGELKLADFGLARQTCVPIKSYSQEVVTLWYRPPDVLLGSVDYSSDIDIWGVGCILLEMLNGKAVFVGNSKSQQLQFIFKYFGKPKDEDFPQKIQKEELKKIKLGHLNKIQALPIHFQRLSSSSRILINSFLQYQGNRRISAEDALKHPFFSNYLPIKELLAMDNTKSIFSLSSINLHDDFSVNKSSHSDVKENGRRIPVKKSHVVMDILVNSRL